MLAIIQSRYNSKRLPGKALEKLGDSSILEHTIYRLKHSSKVTNILVATSTTPSDDAIEREAKKIGIKVFRGSLNNVMLRLHGAAKMVNASYFIRISGDSPFLDWRVVDQAIELNNISNPDVVTNVSPRTFPKGQSVEIIKTETLFRLCKLKLLPEEKEHVTPFFYKNYCDFNVVSFTSGQNFSFANHSVDTPNDLDIAQKVLSESKRCNLSWRELENFFSKHRELN